MPWHLQAMAAVFAMGYQWSRPGGVWLDRRTHLKRRAIKGLFHGAWGFTCEAFYHVGGYPPMQSGQDQALAGRFNNAGIKSASPSEFVSTSSTTATNQSQLALPSYIYRWHTYPGARHISALGKDGYLLRGEELINPVDRMSHHWSENWPARIALSSVS